MESQQQDVRKHKMANKRRAERMVVVVQAITPHMHLPVRLGQAMGGLISEATQAGVFEPQPQNKSCGVEIFPSVR